MPICGFGKICGAVFGFGVYRVIPREIGAYGSQMR